MIWLLILAGFWAGAQNALAGGGSFVTLPALILAGLDPKAANITSCVALFPGQIATGVAGRQQVTAMPGLTLPVMVLISLAGGCAGAALLLVTPVAWFAAMVPWLVLLATLLFAWGKFGRKTPTSGTRLGAPSAAAAQFASSVYGGFFGGGNSIILLTILTFGGLAMRQAGSTKNVLNALINAAAFLMFAFSPHVDWAKAVAVGIGALGGGLAGNWLLQRASDRRLSIGVVGIGLALTIGLFLR